MYLGRCSSPCSLMAEIMVGHGGVDMCFGWSCSAIEYDSHVGRGGCCLQQTFWGGLMSDSRNAHIMAPDRGEGERSDASISM